MQISSPESSSDQSNASPSSASACYPLHLEEEELELEVMAETAGQVEETRLCFHSEEDDADVRPSRLADSLGIHSNLHECCCAIIWYSSIRIPCVLIMCTRSQGRLRKWCRTLWKLLQTWTLPFHQLMRGHGGTPRE